MDPNHLVLHDSPGPIVIERMVADGRELMGENSELSPGTRRIEIRYTSLTYAAADKVRFRYRLDGIDRDWFDSGKHREAFFTQLGHGHYNFQVQASADGGATWTEPGAEISFSVQPHFYETWWFLAACGVVVAGLFGLRFFFGNANWKRGFEPYSQNGSELPARSMTRSPRALPVPRC